MECHGNVKMGSICRQNKNGLPDLSEALLSCRTVNQIDASHIIFAFERKKSMHNDHALSVSYIDDGVSLNVVHVRVAKA